MFQIQIYLPDVDRQKILALALDRENKMKVYVTWNENFKSWVSSIFETPRKPTKQSLRSITQGIWYYLPGIEITFKISEVQVTTITLQP